MKNAHPGHVLNNVQTSIPAAGGSLPGMISRALSPGFKASTGLQKSLFNKISNCADIIQI